jgi:hypothetical protein
MSDERILELSRYFEESTLPCGCVFLGSERSEVCVDHEVLCLRTPSRISYLRQPHEF